MNRFALPARTLLLTLCLASLALACRHDPAPASAEAAAAVVDFPQAEQILRSLAPRMVTVDQELWTLEERMERYNAPAISLAVWQDYDLVWAAAFGLADAVTGEKATTETLFQAGSISKPVAAAAVLSSWQQGQLDLDAPVNDILKSWQVPDNELTATAPVTPRRLLSHTAGTTVHGFPGYATDEDVPSVTQILDGSGPANTSPVRVDIEPGSRYRYSGGGSTIMQLAMSDLTGLAFPELASQRVLEPLGMTSSTYENPLPASMLGKAAAGHHRDGGQVWGKRHTYPEMAAAGLWTTPTDLARFALDVQRALRGDEGTLLSQETAQAMITPVLGDSGLGLFQYESNGAFYFGHGGADEGFQAWLIASREGGHGAAIMVNSDFGMRLASEVVRGVAATLAWPGFAPQKVTPAAVDPASHEPLVGNYHIREHLFLRVSQESDQLLARVLFDADSTHLVPQEDGTFLSLDDGSILRFELDEAGRAVGYANQLRPDDGLRARVAGNEAEVAELLDRGETQAALDLISSSDLSEGSLNNLGYTLLRYQRAEQAVAVFKLVAERFAGSANAQDSLGDAYEVLGDYAKAAAAFRGVLDRLEADDSLDAEQKADYEARSRRRIALYDRRAGAAE